MKRAVKIQQELQDINEDFEDIVENLDNSQRKNSINCTSLKEGVEGGDLVVFLTELFAAWVGAEPDLAISIAATSV